MKCVVSSGGSVCSLRAQGGFWWGHAEWHCTITAHRKAQSGAQTSFLKPQCIRYCEFKEKTASESHAPQCNHLYQPFPAELFLNSPSLLTPQSPAICIKGLQRGFSGLKAHFPPASPAWYCLFKTFHCDTKNTGFSKYLCQDIN